ncbi:substrate-binding domain-containing protein [Synechococcus sp. CS-1324]|uniref:substrate-binding domain-containing protein n=1 Tax=unclassified Synechococcus TaxID=2626047 RepID=UPI000DB85B31|nr:MULTISPECIES: substrate-binding domain-containing protein [unclassified Synechococcus]MCT0212588.1 substrate-binding domain-containing protein [Synechococcus sp. CS-1326]MCT0229969.1 substrate-binding domain-containing protein [Synechococcus sp. CS-1324]MCT0232104.1 substrate-binding domain-containing protein [Synechococcus sp. CS-1327]PZV02216.1 MAG: porin [Cyanobium sp.]
MSSNDGGSTRSGPPPIIYILLLLVGLAALWTYRPRLANLLKAGAPFPSLPGLPQASPGGGGQGDPAALFPLPASVPAGTTVSIDGSTSMVLINEALKLGFVSAFPGTEVSTAAVGSDNGIQALLGGSITLAAISRPLTAEEQGRGLAAIPVTRDRIALVVGVDNPFRRGLSRRQVQQIFQGEITSWTTLGGVDRPIRVLNRPSVSGTHTAFQAIVLEGRPFGTTANITSLARDATTPMLRMLGSDGIGYATYGQVADQQTVRVLAIDGNTPEAATYAFQRPLYYAYRQPADPAAKAFLGYALSEAGRKRIEAGVQGP